MVPTLVITAGDPCGIGPEVIVKALTPMRPRAGRILIIGDWSVFQRTARRLRRSLAHWVVKPVRESVDALRENTVRERADGHLVFLDCAYPARFSPGRPSAMAGRASLGYLDLAVRLIQRGLAHRLVTAPVTKWTIEAAGVRFVGQTEYLARRFGVDASQVAMMFVSRALRIVLLTRHLPVSAVSSRLSPSLIRNTVALTAMALRTQFGIRAPRLALCGLNPHAGEAGLFGHEERRVLSPALQRLRRRGLRVEGPVAADGLFASSHRYDAVICCYHDQGLIPFKMVARDHGCQLTLGLPIVRTSPDHGSALDIAGRGLAHAGSMQYAIRLAATLIHQSPKRNEAPL